MLGTRLTACNELHVMIDKFYHSHSALQLALTGLLPRAEFTTVNATFWFALRDSLRIMRDSFECVATRLNHVCSHQDRR